MKFKSLQDFTYLGNLHNASYRNDVADEEEIHKLLDAFRQLSDLSFRFMPMIFAIDYTQRKYIFFSDNIKHNMGYDVREILDAGLEFMFHISHKEYFKTMNEKVFPANFQFLKSVPPHEQQDYIFSFNSQYRKADGNWAKVLQRGAFITSKETGSLLYSIGLVSDITLYKKDETLIHSIEKVSKTAGNQLIETNYFYPYEEDTLLTKQEKNILKFMADGLSSKMIADKVKISENTIANHRKNMMRKTNTKNVAHLVAFALKNYII